MTQSERREALVGQFVAAGIVAFEKRWSRTNPDHNAGHTLLIRDAFAWAEAVMAESDLRVTAAE